MAQPRVFFLRHETDPEILSSASQLKRAREDNILWRDVCNFLEARIQDHTKVLETATDLITITRSQAIIASCRDLLELPELLLYQIEQEEELNNA